MRRDVTPRQPGWKRQGLRAVVTTSTLVAWMLWSGVAMAQRVPVDEDSSPEEASFVEEEVSPTATQGQLLFVPTFAAHIGYSKRYMVDGSTRDNTHLALYGGASANLVLSRNVLSFVGVGVEMEHHKLDESRNVTYFMPMFQSGLSFTGCHDEVGLLAAMIPCARIYGMAGYRPAPPNRSGSLRLGVGASSIWLTAIAASAEFILPSHYEFITEIDAHGNRLMMFRIGLGF